MMLKKIEKLLNRELYYSGEQFSENQRKRKEREILRPCLRTKEAMGDEGNGGTHCNGVLGTIQKDKKARRFGNKDEPRPSKE